MVGRYLACVAALAGVIWLLGPSWLTGYPPAFPDSSSYVAVADDGLFSTGFWFGQRPPTYPLLIWIVGPSARAVVLAQTLIAVAAWAWLCATVWSQIGRRWLAGATIGLLLLVAAETRWAFWHTALLTESLSGSLAVAGVAAWWRWFSGPDRFRLVVAVGLTAGWMLIRDSNAVTFAVVAVPALVAALVLERRATGPRRRGMAVALAALLGVSAFSLVAQYTSARGETSFHNNVGLRWLVDDDMRAWMVDRGMPLGPALADRAGSDAWADGEAFMTSPFLEEYREWADGRGRVAAAASFVLRADWYLDRFWDDLPTYTRTDHLAYDSFGVADRLPERPLGPLDPVGSRAGLVVWLGLVGAAAVIVARCRPRMGWFVPFVSAPVLADLYLSYVADAIEVGRHLVGPMLRFEVVAIVSVALAVDAVLDGMATREPAAVPNQHTGDTAGPGRAEHDVAR